MFPGFNPCVPVRSHGFLTRMAMVDPPDLATDKTFAETTGGGHEERTMLVGAGAKWGAVDIG